jgi:hypothetical protein
VDGVSALEERRLCAREASRDVAPNLPWISREAVDAAVEVATRVRVDDAIVQASRPGFRMVPGSVVWTRTRAKIVRAFEAAGFEVTT